MSRLSRGARFVSAMVVVYFLCACDGGGSASYQSEYRYTGSRAAAPISEKNANILAADLVYAYYNFDPPIFAASSFQAPLNTQSAGFFTALLQRLNQTALRTAQAQIAAAGADNTAAASAPIAATVVAATSKESDLCEWSGAYTQIISLRDDGTGTITMKFHSCNDGSGTLDGTLKIEIFVYDTATNTVTSGRVTYSDLSLTESGRDVTMYGNVDVSVTPDGKSNTYQVNISFFDHFSQKTIEWHDVDVRYDHVLQSDFIGYVETITGRIYDSEEGYIDVVTEQPLRYKSYLDQVPQSGGPLVLNGANGSQVSILILTSGNARVYVDADADGEFEASNLYSLGNMLGSPLVNRPPSVTLAISPTTPDSTSQLKAVVTASDPEAEPLFYTYIWSRNGVVMTEEQTDTLSPAGLDPGDTITVKVSVSDGSNTVVRIASVVIGGIPP